MQMRKMIKWATKLAIKRKAKGKRRERGKKHPNRFAKEKRNLAYAHARKTKKPINYIQLVQI